MKKIRNRYETELKQLQQIGKTAVTKYDLNAQQATRYILTADSHTLTLPNGRVMTELFNERPIDKELSNRFLQPIIKIEDANENEIVTSEVTHADQMHPASLKLSLLGILSGELPVHKKFKDVMLERAAMLLFGQAGIAHFAVQSNIENAYNKFYPDGQRYIDAGRLKNYVLTAQSFYRILAQRGVPTVDVHDFVHHAAQFRAWPGFFIPLYNIAAIVNKELSDEDSKLATSLFRLKQLITFISFATAEYSVVADGDSKNNYSFGCLLYQYPRKSPMANLNSLDGVTAREFTDWSVLRSLMSLQRRVKESQAIFKNQQKIDWLTELGYQFPTEYHPVVTKQGKTVREPVSNLGRDHNIPFDRLTLPDGPEDLFEKAMNLLNIELNYAKRNNLNMSQSGLHDVENWLNTMSTSHV